MHILVVEDSRRISAFLVKGLSEEGYTVTPVADGDDGFELAREGQFDAAIVDVMLPGRTGIEMIRDLRAEGVDLPIILLTARDKVEDRISGLDAGADDYLVKPFDFTELTARIRAVLRRSGSGAAPVLRLGNLELDPGRHEVKVDGEDVTLTPREFALLEYLLRNEGRPLSRSTIMEHVWGIRFDPGTNLVDVFINSLRNKLDPYRDLIHTVRGVGYVAKAVEGGE
ncbi:MAG TPA: response regulator transcription factor [Longimicrobiaceae bacterium]|nr:response regulator transcription factor [Longimicrobiaceae bacterium]